MNRLAKAQGSNICDIFNELDGKAIDAFIAYQKDFREDYPPKLEGNIIRHLSDCATCMEKHKTRWKEWQIVDKMLSTWAKHERQNLD